MRGRSITRHVGFLNSPSPQQLLLLLSLFRFIALLPDECGAFLSNHNNRLSLRQRDCIATSLFAGSTSNKNTDKPRLIVFDLDGCLWKPELYELARRRRGQQQQQQGGGGRENSSTPVQSPFIPLPGGNRCRSQGGSVVTLHPDVPSILHELATKEEWTGTQLAISSRTDQPEWAHELLTLFTLPSDKSGNAPTRTLQDVICGPWEMVSTERKTLHLERISKETNIPLTEIMFFDNDIGNCKSVSRLGVTVGLAAPLTRTIFDRTVSKYPVKWGVVGLEVK